MKQVEYRLIINETARSSPRTTESYRINDIKRSFWKLADVYSYLVDRYGKLPSGRNKIRRDNLMGQSEIVGFLKSYWNADYSHAPIKHYWQTDWITIEKLVVTPISIREVLFDLICHEPASYCSGAE